MRKFLLLLLLWPSLAFGAGTCTGAFTVSNSSTQILAANDVPGAGRHYILIQNIGGSNNMYCCMATTNACTTSIGFLITAGGGQWLMNSSAGGLPGGDVACITASSTTTATVCDW